MSYADELYRKNCRLILDTGYSDENEDVRPHWEDGTPAHTKKIFGVVNRYNLAEEFPMITLRRTYWKSALDELLWIYQRKSNNIHDLGSKIWDQWADDSGSIGKAYGYQMYKKNLVKVDVNKVIDLFGAEHVLAANISSTWANAAEVASVEGAGYDAVVSNLDGAVYMGQVEKVIYDLTYNPASRRIMHTTWNPADDTEMHLSPCAYSMTYNVVDNKLNAILNQRSQDMLAAGAWNVCQYAMLTMLLAKVTGYEPGEFVHVIADCHIYDRHFELVEELLENASYAAPLVTVDPNLKSFRDATKNSIIVKNYEYGEFDAQIPVAV